MSPTCAMPTSAWVQEFEHRRACRNPTAMRQSRQGLAAEGEVAPKSVPHGGVTEIRQLENRTDVVWANDLGWIDISGPVPHDGGGLTESR